MNAKDVIKNTLGMGQMVLSTYIGDLSDDDLMVRSVPGVNHIRWQLGHLIASEHKLLSDAGFTVAPLPDGFAESYTKETSTSDDPAKFHTKDEYVSLMAEQRAATMSALDGVPDADLEKDAPEEMRAYAPKIGDVFNLIGIHLVMHGAQFVSVRRKLDKPILI